MKRIIPDLHVEGCKDALEYYQAVFGGEIKNVQMADGKDMFKGHEGKVIHAELHINANCTLYLADIFREKVEGRTMDLLLEMESEEEINRLYTTLSKEGSVQFELQKTFWGAYHALVRDRYGVTWALNYSLNRGTE